jgi:two-component system response regulator ResD
MHSFFELGGQIMNKMKTILIVDDEVRIRRMLKDFFEIKGFQIIEATNGQEAIDNYYEHIDNIDLILLDVMMPIKDGIVVLKEIREYSHVPIIMLTARTEEYNQLDYYNYGADDIVPKPFSPKLLYAHVEAVLRRCSPTDKSYITLGSLLINDECREVFSEDEKLELTPKEYDLLSYFMKNTSIVLTRETILNAVWGFYQMVYHMLLQLHHPNIYYT